MQITTLKQTQRLQLPLPVGTSLDVSEKEGRALIACGIARASLARDPAPLVFTPPKVHVPTPAEIIARIADATTLDELTEGERVITSLKLMSKKVSAAFAARRAELAAGD